MASASKKARPCISSLEQACHHCPLVLFAFLTDADAANFACACSALSTICKRSYDIKRELPMRPVLAGLYPCVVRKVCFSGSDWLSLVPELPSTVTSLSVDDLQNRWRVTDLPRSLAHFSFVDAPARSTLLASITAAEDWPPGLTSLELDVSDGVLPPLPSNLLAFGSRDLKDDGGRLPDSLTKLWLGIANDELWLHLPSHLTTLEMELSTETTTQNLAHLPASLTHLTLSSDGSPVHTCFHADTADSVRLPSRLRYLHLESVPYRAFRDLPSSLESLAVTADMMPVNYWGFNMPIEFWGFDGPICHASLQTLELPPGFNHPITANHLPSLRELCLVTGCTRSLDDLPASLRKLTLNKTGEKQSLDRLPADLTELDLRRSCFNHPMHRLPLRLLSLFLSYKFDHPLDALPSSLTRLDLSEAYGFNRPLDDLPASLQVLILHRYFDQPLRQLPYSLRVLQFDPSCPFNHPLPPLPEWLSVLHLGDSFDQPLQHLPRGLTDLKLGRSFNHPLPLAKPGPALVPSNEAQEQESSSFHPTHSSASDVDGTESKAMTYPLSLRSLQLGKCFNQPLSLPPSLTSLSIGTYGYSSFDQLLPMSSLPPTLTDLTLPKSHHFKDVAAVRERCPFLPRNCIS